MTSRASHLQVGAIAWGTLLQRAAVLGGAALGLLPVQASLMAASRSPENAQHSLLYMLLARAMHKAANGLPPTCDLDDNTVGRLRVACPFGAGLTHNLEALSAAALHIRQFSMRTPHRQHTGSWLCSAPCRWTARPTSWCATG